jgi:two-component sensor histidine kinase
MLTIAAALIGLLFVTLISLRLLRSEKAQSAAAYGQAAEFERLVVQRTQELLAANARTTALLDDVNHRVGNNLSIVAALLGMQARRSDNPELPRELATARQRIESISSSQRKLRHHEATDYVYASELA